jgi:hypothetical protein
MNFVDLQPPTFTNVRCITAMA